MGLSRFEGDCFFAGNVSFGGSVVMPDGAVGDAEIEAFAGVAQTKLEHQHRSGLGQPNTTATSETRVVATIYGTSGTLLSFKAGSIAPCSGAATITVDLKKNGASVLSAVITLDSANTARVAESGSFSSTTLAAGDVLEVVVTATAGGGTLGTGLFAEVRWAEDAQ